MIPEEKRTAIVDTALAWMLLIPSLILLVITTYNSLHIPLGYDEAYNLQIVDSLANGKGYASFGALRGSGSWLFDPHITTGPIILVPLSAIWALSDGSILAIRIFMLSFLWIYTIGLLLLVKRLNGGLVSSAIAVAATLCIIDLQGGQVLGELAAAATLIFAAGAIAKRKPLLSALFVGIAIQIKLVYGLAGVILLSLSFFLFWSILRFNLKIKTVLLAITIVVTPSIMFELFRLVSMAKPSSYMASLYEFKTFLRGENINNSGTWLNPNVLGTKISGLFHAMPLTAWLAIGLAIAFVLLSSIGTSLALESAFKRNKESSERPTRQIDPFVNIALFSLAIAGLAMLAGWITQSSQLGARQALPFLFLFIPATFALVSSLAIYLRAEGEKEMSTLSYLIIVGLFGLLVYPLTSLSISKLRGDARAEAVEQVHVADMIKQEKPESLFVDGWWQNPEYQLLTRIPGVPVRVGSSQLLVVQDYQVYLQNTNWERYRNMCSKIIYSTSRNLVCWLPEVKQSDLRIETVEWGPQSTEVGVVPNVQPDGGAGIWIKVKKVDAQLIGPVKVYFSEIPSWVDYVNPDGELITASVPSSLFKKSGTYDVTVRLTALGRTFPIGRFTVSGRK